MPIPTTTVWTGWSACLFCRLAAAGCLLAASGPAPAWQTGAALSAVKRLYVEPFTMKTGEQKTRDEVIAELRKLSSIAIVRDQSSADAILAGDGEIWVRGYRSLNPRSGRLPSNGTPVYAGFLSVELKDARGETLWSYLATQGAASEDISKDLAKRVAKRLAEALAQGDGAAPPG